MMEWGIRKADRLGLEIFIEATEEGLPLYRKHGFAVLKDIEMKASPAEASEKLEMLAGQLYWHGYSLRRDVRGADGNSESAIPQ